MGPTLSSARLHRGFPVSLGPSLTPGPATGPESPVGFEGQTLGGISPPPAAARDTQQVANRHPLVELNESIEVPFRHSAMTQRDHLPVHPTAGTPRARRTGRSGEEPRGRPARGFSRCTPCPPAGTADTRPLPHPQLRHVAATARKALAPCLLSFQPLLRLSLASCSQSQ